uniref:Sterile alpha motif domain containing 15 n=1 Tax=Catagonus wagneri TaxID=51154 RepID=A0A8C4FHD8_9CETA
MAEVPEDYDSDLGEDEDLPCEKPKLPESPKATEDDEPDVMAGEGPELTVETDQEPETEEEDLKEGARESARAAHPLLKPTRASEEELPNKSEVDFWSETERGIPQEVKSETSRQIGGELFKDMAVPEDEEGEQPEEEAESNVTDVHTESAKETDLELPKETESEVPGSTISETRLELLEESKPEAREEPLREQYEQTGLEPTEQTKPEFPSEKPRKSIEEADLQPLQMTTPEIPEETQSTSPEKRTEPLREAKPEFPEEKPRLSAEDTHRKSTEEEISEPLEEVKSEFSEEKSTKPIEKTLPEPSGETRPEVQEEIQRKSTVEKVLEPPEQTEPEFPKKEPRKPTEETDQMPPQQTKPEVQEKTETEPTMEGDLELPDNVEQLLGKETLVEFAREDRTTKFKHSADKEELEHSDHPIGKLLLNETKKVSKDSVSGSLTVSEANSMNTDYEFSKELQSLFQLSDTNYEFYSYFSESRKDIRESSSEKKAVDLSPESMKLEHKKAWPCKHTDLQFEYLEWSPEEVAEWISKLGFPQYKECFTTNFISGRKLIHVNCSNLPQMGITDFQDMKVISRHTRKLLRIEEPLFTRSISLPYRDNIGLFLEQKGHSGVKSDSLTLSKFVHAAGLQDAHIPERNYRYLFLE